MSSPVRRSLRTTAAAAGIAALGVGFAGHALAAPAGSGLLDTGGLGSGQATSDGAVLQNPNALAGLPATPASDTLAVPQLFAFEPPSVSTASPAAPTAPVAPDPVGRTSEITATDGSTDTTRTSQHEENAQRPVNPQAGGFRPAGPDAPPPAAPATGLLPALTHTVNAPDGQVRDPQINQAGNFASVGPLNGNTVSSVTGVAQGAVANPRNVQNQQVGG